MLRRLPHLSPQSVEHAAISLRPIVARNQRRSLSTADEIRRSGLQLGSLRVTNERLNGIGHLRFQLQTADSYYASDADGLL